MKNVDYIIVGLGLGGVLSCERLRALGKSYVVIDDKSQQSSVVAGGLYNPVVLKRFTPVWQANSQLELALPIYKQLEKRLQVQLVHEVPVLRLFASTEEQNNWFLACDKPRLTAFLDPDVVHYKNSCIDAEYGYGKVLHTGRVDTQELIRCYQKELQNNDLFYSETFNYKTLSISEENIVYKDINAKHIVFAEGFGLKQNPFFNELPLNGTKGELIVIHAPNLQIDFVLKSGVFLIPIQDDHYIVGATYEWEDKTNTVTQSGKEELLLKLKKFLICNFEVVHQMAGIRPTVIDRRPLVGTHQHHKNVHILNGLGTRGVMIAPYAASQLFNHIENQVALNPEIDIKRFN